MGLCPKENNMSVRKIVVDNNSYYLARRVVLGEVKQKTFKATAAGEKQALRYDDMLAKMQKESKPHKSSYLRSKYGFLRGISITRNTYDGKHIPVLIISFRRPDGHWHHRALEVRCGRTFRSCFDIMVGEIETVLKVSKHTRSTDGYKKLIAATYTYLRAKDKYHRDSSKEDRPSKTSGKMKKR
jgi:hypothetical protein